MRNTTNHSFASDKEEPLDLLAFTDSPNDSLETLFSPKYS